MKLKSIVVLSAAVVMAGLPVFAKSKTAKKFAVNSEKSLEVFLTFDEETESYTAKGNPVTGDGFEGKGLVFDGSDDYLELDKKILICVPGKLGILGTHI